MLDKGLEESNCDIDLAVIWSVNAKNFLLICMASHHTN